MKTIQIAPHREDCTITKNCIKGKMNRTMFIYTLPAGLHFNLIQKEDFIKSFQMAIALSSKSWQVEELLNSTFNAKGKFETIKVG